MFWEEKQFQLISHEGGAGLYMLPACDLIDGEFLPLRLSHKSQEELKVEKWVSVSWDVNAERKRARETKSEFEMARVQTGGERKSIAHYV